MIAGAGWFACDIWLAHGDRACGAATAEEARDRSQDLASPIKRVILICINNHANHYSNRL